MFFTLIINISIKKKGAFASFLVKLGMLFHAIITLAEYGFHWEDHKSTYGLLMI